MRRRAERPGRWRFWATGKCLGEAESWWIHRYSCGGQGHPWPVWSWFTLQMPVSLLRAGAVLLGSCLVSLSFPGSAAGATSLEDIRKLENLINASGSETVVSIHCPSDHAGYYENNGKGIDRLVICKRNVDLGDLEAVWEVMAHESTHIMQSCTGTTAIADELMPRTYRELQTMAPHYAKLVGSRYPSSEQRLEAEAFWMELQTPELVLALFRKNCAAFLDRNGRTP